MANLTRWEASHWDPFKELESIGERFNRVFGQIPLRHEIGHEAMTVTDWVPTVDIIEDEREYTIKAEIPEVDKKNVKVTVQENVLTVQGERRKEVEEKSRRFHRVERSYGKFIRSFVLPEDAAEDKMKAEFKDGILLVHLPKTEKPKAKTLEVRVE
jgi:HSP20 family protein